MRKLYEYQTVQKYLIRHYENYGEYASVGEILPTITEYQMIGDGDQVPGMDLHQWDTEDLKQLIELYNHSFLDFFRVQTDVDHWITKDVYQARARNEVFIFLHFSHHKTELRRKEVLEFCYVLSGEAWLYQEHGMRILHQGDFAIIGSGNIHDIIASPGSVVLGIQIRWQHFEEYFHNFLRGNNFMVYLFHQFLYKDSTYYYVFHLEPGIEIRRIIRSLLSEFSPYSAYAAPICIGYLEILFYKILQIYEYESSEETALKEDPDLAFSAIVRSIYQSPQVSLRDLAKQFHYTESYLSRLIHQKTGTTYSALTGSIRLERACSLLSNTALPISKVAEQTGYQSQNHFAKAFRQKMGMTPSEYRSGCQKKNNSV